MNDTSIALALLLRLLGHPADPEQLRHRFAPDGRALDATATRRALRRLGFRARLVRASWERLAGMPLPALAMRHDGGFVVLARASAERVLVHDPREGRVLTLSRECFAEVWSGSLLLVAARARPSAAGRRFDLGWFLPAVVKYRRELSEVLLASLVLQLLALVSPLVFQVVIDKVLVHRAATTLDVLVVALVGAAILEALLGAVRAYLFSHTTTRIDVELGARLFRHLIALPLPYFEARRVGDTVARVREQDNVRAFLTGSALTMVVDLAFAAVFVALMLTYSGTLTAVVLASVPIYVVLSLIVTPVLRSRLEEKFTLGAEHHALLVESITNLQTLQSGATEPQAVRRWDEQLAAYVASSFRVTRLAAFAGEGIQLVQKLVTVAILWLGALQVIDGAMTVGGLVAFNMLAGRVSQPILRLAQLWQELQQTGISVARLGDILNTRTESSVAGARTQLPTLRGAIQFEDVRFRYRPDGSEVLRGISFRVQPGEMLGIVGRSGSGKSTVAKLLQRLYVPERGRVLADGVDLALADPAWLRRQVGVVLQENRLFARSIRENIALADPGAPMEAVIQAAKLAGAHEFILELPEGYDTLVGEQGATLSGGQRQRIAIARALMTNPRVLIFDEATSALDYESERIIQDNMRFIAKGRTVIVIAHRLTAVRDAHRILVMEGGQIVEQGSHVDLVKRPEGRYARLHALQAG